ncbi:MAG TPA: hypothetical protein PLD59_05070 [Tepidisphaeraceae bacterium]|nr:hypothetical protein [Tepidisphaeraceae bacterium]
MMIKCRQILDLTLKARRGGALVMVVVTTGVASSLGLALLAASTMQTKAGANSASVAQAAYLAESGVNLAMYYLQNPAAYTGAKPDGYFPGATHANLCGVQGSSVTTDVTYDSATKRYAIRSVASVGGADAPVSRTQVAVVKPIPTGNLEVQPIVDALVTNGDLLIDDKMTITGSPGGVRTIGKVRVVAGGRVVGNVTSDDAATAGSGSISGEKRSHAQASAEVRETEKATGKSLLEQLWSALLSPAVVTPAPPTDDTKLVMDIVHHPDLRTYRFKLLLTGTVLTYNAVNVSSTSLKQVTLGPTLANPAGIYWSNQDVVLDETIINGTLIVTGGKEITVKSGLSTVTAMSGYPAIVSDGVISLKNPGNLTVNGLVRATKIVAESANNDGSVEVNGALLLSDPIEPIESSRFLGPFKVTYNSGRANIPGFGMAVADPNSKGLQVVSWSGN